MRRLALPSLALLATLGLAACGASGPSSSQPAATTASPAAASEPATSGQAATACAATSDPATVEVSIAGNAFSPRTVEASVGDVIAWTNADAVPHSAIVGSAGCGTETLRDGDSGSLVFSAPGTYDYVCGIHSNMTGTIEIRG